MVRSPVGATPSVPAGRRHQVGRTGHDPARLPIGINSHTYVAETSRQAGDDYYPTYAAMMNRIGRERGWSPMGRGQFEMGRSPCGALVVGSPEEVVEKILYGHELFARKRFMAQISVGAMPHEKVMRAIELFGTEVAPAVRQEIERRSTSSAGGQAAI
jgi:alkanesulfonate monooxygenase SsuD/methylene tetrahydromethanopterin reductase-like flavin-dependent oxidoreductase (luciferase family)